MYLLVNGCSHAHGIQGPTLKHKPHSIDYYFKGFISNNIARGGISNFAIYKSTIEYCEENKVDLAIICWTTHERFEFSYDDIVYQYSSGKIFDSEDLKKFYKFATLHMANWSQGLKDLLHYQFALQTYFKQKNIEYIFCNMFNHIPKDCQIPLWKRIDISKYYMPHDSFIEKYLELYPEAFDNTMHVKHQNVIKKIATELLEFMR